jgi:serine/threonine-protein kinase RsbW
MTTQVFAGEQGVGEFRRMVTATLAGLPEDVIEGGRVVASELATNAVTHSRSRLAGGKYVGKVEIGTEAVLIEVEDEGADLSAPQAADADEHGRGLVICQAFGQLTTRVTESGGRRSGVLIPLATTAHERYAQLTAVLGGVWDELFRVDGPERRAHLAERAADASRELSTLAPEVFAAADLAVYGDWRVWQHYAATERAIAGELELPAELDGSLVGQHPDVLLLWVELAASEHRSERAEVLLQLAAIIGGGAAHTLARLAETEQALTTAADAAWHAAIAARASTEGAVPEATVGAPAGAGRGPGQDRSRRWWRPMLPPGQIRAVSFVLAGVALLPVLDGWPARDVVVIVLLAVAVEIYTVLPAIRPPRLLAWLARLTWPFSR